MKRFAKPYADVLLEAALEAKAEWLLADELERFVRILGDNAELAKLAANPAVSPDEKEKVIAEIAARGEFSDLAKRALLLFVRNRRLSDVGDVLEAYREQLDRKEGVAHAEISAATELSPAEKAKLEEALGRAVGRKIRMTISVDPTLVAGVVAKVGSTVFDASLRGEIRRLRRTLSTGQVSA